MNLTPRELEILQLRANGLQRHAIAAQLFIAYGTVKKIFHNILGKLGANNETTAIVTAMRRGWIR